MGKIKSNNPFLTNTLPKHKYPSAFTDNNLKLWVLVALRSLESNMQLFALTRISLHLDLEEISTQVLCERLKMVTKPFSNGDTLRVSIKIGRKRALPQAAFQLVCHCQVGP